MTQTNMELYTYVYVCDFMHLHMLYTFCGYSVFILFTLEEEDQLLIN